MTYKIAALDIETLSLDINAVVSDIAMVIVDIQSPQAYNLIETDLRNPNVITYEWYLPVLDQIELGRTVDPKTIRFHKEHRKTPMLGNQLYPAHHQPASFKEVFASIRSAIAEHNVQELWMNHTSFDYSRLHTLVLQLGEEPLWHYRLEYDIFTLKKALRLPPSTTEAKHVAIADCVWLLETLKSAAPYLQRTWG